MRCIDTCRYTIMHGTHTCGESEKHVKQNNTHLRAIIPILIHISSYVRMHLCTECEHIPSSACPLSYPKKRMILLGSQPSTDNFGSRPVGIANLWTYGRLAIFHHWQLLRLFPWLSHQSSDIVRYTGSRLPDIAVFRRLWNGSCGPGS